MGDLGSDLGKPTHQYQTETALKAHTGVPTGKGYHEATTEKESNY